MTANTTAKTTATCRECGYSLAGATAHNSLCDECDDNQNNPFSVDPDLAALDAEIAGAN